jgi:hypothetical protein
MRWNRNKRLIKSIILCLIFLALLTVFLLYNVDLYDYGSIHWEDTSPMESLRIASDGKLQIRIHQETRDCYKSGEDIVLNYTIKNISDEIQYISSNDIVAYGFLSTYGDMTPYFYTLGLDYLYTHEDMTETFQMMFEGQDYIPLEPSQQIDRTVEIMMPSEIQPRSILRSEFEGTKSGIYFVKIFYKDYKGDGHWYGEISSNLSAFCFVEK